MIAAVLARRYWALGALLVVAGLAGAAYRRSNADRAAFDANFAGVSLRDQDDRPFRTQALAGKIALHHFIFTSCPSICPRQTRALVQVQRALSPAERDGVHFVSITIDPENDTPAALKAFAGRMGATFSGWSFVTGPPTELKALAARLHLFPSDDPAQRPAVHSTTLWLVDARGRLVQKYAGNPPDVKRLVEEIRRLRELAR